MPTIIIEGPSDVSRETKENLIKDVSEVVSNNLNVPLNVVNIVYHDNDADNFGVGGQQLSKLLKQ